MRDFLMRIWRKLTQIKALEPLIKFIRWFCGTDFFNTCLDFLETRVFHTSYDETAVFYKLNTERIERIASWFADEKSRKVYRNILAYRSTHHRKYMRGIVDRDQYFDKDIIHFGTGEGFVDCGAYKGDTVAAFVRHLPDPESYRHIIAFEPDDYNYKMLLRYLNSHHFSSSKVLAIHKGTWSSADVLHFRANTEEACRIEDDGEDTIETDTIDRVAGKRRITYIKMDVEGAETESLKGADEVISRDHPRLAISIYHSDEEMLSIVEYIHQKYPFYDLYVRHYTYFYGDTVLYAIDPERPFDK